MQRPEVPTKEQIREARLAAGLSQSKAAELVCVGTRAWQRWEYGERRMSPGTWLLFQMRLREESRDTQSNEKGAGGRND
jgi:transcriptional regulator with XRE-family HTH domain